MHDNDNVTVMFYNQIMNIFDNNKGKETANNIEQEIDDIFGISKDEIELSSLKDTKTLNPIKKAQLLKEIKEKEKIIAKKKKEIEKLRKKEERKKETKKNIIRYVCGCAILLAIIGVMNYFEELHKISFSNKIDTAYIGDIVNLDYTAWPSSAKYDDKDIKIVLSNSNIEENDNQYIATKEGNTKVQVLYKDKIFDELDIDIVPVEAEEISAKDINVGLNLTKNVEISFTPENTTDKSFTLKSKDESIAKIDGEKLIGLSEGTTKVVATSSNGTTTEFSVNVKIIEPTSINFEHIKNTYTIGDTEQLKIKYDPKDISIDKIEWYSSDNRVVKIDDSGKLEASNVGKATITAKYSDSTYCSKEVEVLYPYADSISISNNYNSVYVGNSLKLYYSFYPNSVRNETVKWSSSNEKIATVNESGLVTAVAVGKVTIKILTDNNVSDSIDIDVIEKPVTITRSNTTESGTETIVGDGITVYVTTYGECYHINPTCPNSKNISSMNIEKAMKYYRPCEKCASGY